MKSQPGALVRTGEASPRTPPTRVASASAPLRAGAVAITILVKPFGAIQFDGAAAGKSELPVHTLATSPGRHTVRVTCHTCEDTEHQIEVTAAEGQQFHLEPNLKPSQLTFDVDPPEATVRIAEVSRRASDTRARPFDIRTRQGPSPGRHHVEYEVSHPGFVTQRKVAEIAPEQHLTVTAKLSPSPSPE